MPNTATAKNKTKVILPENYDPAKDDDYMGEKHLEFFRLRLQEWKDELLEESKETLTHLKEENWQEADINDRATVETDTAFELRTRNRYRKLIDKIDAALRRLEEGNYGYCDETGEKIGVGRLKARPIATLSIEAQERHENYERTHIDEDEA